MSSVFLNIDDPAPARVSDEGMTEILNNPELVDPTISIRAAPHYAASRLMQLPRSGFHTLARGKNVLGEVFEEVPTRGKRRTTTL